MAEPEAADVLLPKTALPDAQTSYFLLSFLVVLSLFVAVGHSTATTGRRAHMHPDSSASRELLALCSPLHKVAFGAAVGLVSGLTIVILTIFHLLAEPVDAPDLELLNQFFYGYSISWTGTVIGLLWALSTGVVVGWLVAFVRNLATAMWIFVVRAKADLSRATDLLGQF